MHHVTKLDRELAVTPSEYVGHCEGYSQQILVDRSVGSPHMTLRHCELEPGGVLRATLHSFEVSVYVFDGVLAVTMQGRTYRLEQDHALVVPVGVTYQVTALDGRVRWLQMSAPAELRDGRRADTFFPHRQLQDSEPHQPDGRDPRDRHALVFDPASMDLKRLAGGSDVDAPAVSPSMATALLAYSGIGVKMLIDQRLGAQLHCMFIVDYQPTAIAHPHDHPFEEAYVFVEGEVHALIDGEGLVFHPGDVLWCGVGADHGFENRSNGLVRWIEVQAPQPPAQHSYRFSREWEHLARKIAQGD